MRCLAHPRLFGIVVATLGIAILGYLPYQSMQATRHVLTQVADSYHIQKELSDIIRSDLESRQELLAYLRTGDLGSLQRFISTIEEPYHEWEQVKRLTQSNREMNFGVREVGETLREQEERGKAIGQEPWSIDLRDRWLEAANYDRQKLGRQVAILVDQQEATLQASIGQLGLSERNTSLAFGTVALLAIGLLTQLVIRLRREVAQRQQNARLAEDLCAQAKSANQSKSLFLAHMSHEIRTPMTAIIGFSELLSQSHLAAEDQSSYIEIIRRNARSLLQILNDILDLSKVEAGHIDIVKEAFELQTTLEEWLSLLQLKALEKDLQLKLHWASALPKSILSDPTRLRQIILNIVGNAIKFTQSGSVTVSVTWLGCEEEGAGRLELHIRDTGCGISKAAQERIFEAFKQADSSTTRFYGGTGLGLALSRKLARLLGGDICLLESVEGQGSVFLVSIPALALVTKHQALAKTKDIERVLPLEGMRILLADDAPDNQLLLGRFLAHAGALVEVACDGHEAINKASAGNFELVLMDIQMPSCDGFTATRQLRKQGYIQPIVALTAHAMKEAHDEALSAGFQACLSKPVSYRDLVETLSNLRRRPEQRLATETPNSKQRVQGERLVEPHPRLIHS